MKNTIVSESLDFLEIMNLWTEISQIHKGEGVETFGIRYHGPIKVLERVGQIAYSLELPARSQVHRTFHVSCFKKLVRKWLKFSNILLPPEDVKSSILILEWILEAFLGTSSPIKSLVFSSLESYLSTQTCYGCFLFHPFYSYIKTKKENRTRNKPFQL